MLVCKFVYAGCEGAGSFAGARCSLAMIYALNIYKYPVTVMMSCAFHVI